MPPPIYLFDTNAIIEAVRVACWPAISGALRVQSVVECCEECRRGEGLSTGYVAVTDDDLARLDAVHAVTDDRRAALALIADQAAALDDGERDLFAHALALDEVRTAETRLICSPDRASVRLGVARGWNDRLVSLEETMEAAGARSRSPLRPHFRRRWLAEARTAALLEGLD